MINTRNDWYSSPMVLYNIIPQLKNRYLSVRKLSKKNPGKIIVARYYMGYSIDLLIDTLRRNDVLGDSSAKIYYDLSTWKNSEGITPLFSFNKEKRDVQKMKFTGNPTKNDGEYITLMKTYDFAIDLDAKDIMKAHKEAVTIKGIFDKYKLPYQLRFSVTGDTPILSNVDGEVGLVEIKELVKDFDSGKKISVLSLDKNNRVVWSEVYDKLEHDDKIYNIYHKQSKFPIKATKDHSVYVLDDLEIREKEVDKLVVGDYLITPKTKPVQKSKKKIDFEYKNGNGKTIKESVTLNKKILKLIGYYLGDGHISVNNNIGFSFNVKEIKFIDEVKDMISKMYHGDYFKNESEKITKLRNSGVCVRDLVNHTNMSSAMIEKVIYNKYIPSVKGLSYNESQPNSGEHQINMNSGKWFNFFNTFCGRGAHNKSLPSFVWALGKSDVLELLRGYINSDGHKLGKYKYRIKSVSGRLITELCWLLKLHGISCSIYDEKIKPHKMPNGTIFKGSYVHMIDISKSEIDNIEMNKFSPEHSDRLLPTKYLKYIYNVCKPKRFEEHRKEHVVLRKENANYKRIIGVIKWFKEFKSKDFDKKSLEYIKRYEDLIKSDVGFVRIKNITTGKTEKVYDISVNGTENFFGGKYPILLHNSGSKGFHFCIDERYITTRISPIKRPGVFGKIMDNMIKDELLKTVDTSIYDARRILKLAYSLCNNNGIEYVALPLSDFQFENWTYEKMKMLNVMKEVKLFKRGLLERNHGLSDTELRANVTRFMKDYK